MWNCIQQPRNDNPNFVICLVIVYSWCDIFGFYRLNKCRCRNIWETTHRMLPGIRQWTISKGDTLDTKTTARFSDVSALETMNCTHILFFNLLFLFSVQKRSCKETSARSKTKTWKNMRYQATPRMTCKKTTDWPTCHSAKEGNYAWIRTKPSWESPRNWKSRATTKTYSSTPRPSRRETRSVSWPAVKKKCWRTGISYPTEAKRSTSSQPLTTTWRIRTRTAMRTKLPWAKRMKRVALRLAATTTARRSDFSGSPSSRPSLDWWSLRALLRRTTSLPWVTRSRQSKGMWVRTGGATYPLTQLNWSVCGR